MEKIIAIVDVGPLVQGLKKRVADELKEHQSGSSEWLIFEWFQWALQRTCNELIMMTSAADSRSSYLNVFRQFEVELMTFVRMNINKETVLAMRNFGIIQTLFTGTELYIVTCNPI